MKQVCLYDPTFSASPYADVPHGLGVYPDFVTVQLTLSGGYLSEAQGILKCLLFDLLNVWWWDI